MKFALAALVGLTAATEGYYSPYYKARRANWSPTTTVTSGQAFAKYGERNAVVRCEEFDSGLPTEASWKQAIADQAKECDPCPYGKCGYGYKGYKGYSGYGGCTSKGCNFGTSFGSSLGSSRGASFSPVKKQTVAGYAGWEHPSMRLLRSLGKEPEVAGKAWGYAELTKEPCGNGFVCGYGCLDPCVEDEVVIEKKEPSIIKMWDNPVFTPNVRLTDSTWKLGLKVPGNPVIPAAAPIPVPVRKVRERKMRPYKEDLQPNHVVKTYCDTCGSGSCDPCKTSGEPDDFTPSYNVGRYHSKKSTNYLW
jgi:hypothetical protein